MRNEPLRLERRRAVPRGDGVRALRGERGEVGAQRGLDRLRGTVDADPRGRVVEAPQQFGGRQAGPARHESDGDGHRSSQLRHPLDELHGHAVHVGDGHEKCGARAHGAVRVRRAAVGAHLLERRELRRRLHGARPAGEVGSSVRDEPGRFAHDARRLWRRQALGARDERRVRVDAGDAERLHRARYGLRAVEGDDARGHELREHELGSFEVWKAGVGRAPRAHQRHDDERLAGQELLHRWRTLKALQRRRRRVAGPPPPPPYRAYGRADRGDGRGPSARLWGARRGEASGGARRGGPRGGRSARPWTAAGEPSEAPRGGRGVRPGRQRQWGGGEARRGEWGCEARGSAWGSLRSPLDGRRRAERGASGRAPPVRGPRGAAREREARRGEGGGRPGRGGAASPGSCRGDAGEARRDGSPAPERARGGRDELRGGGREASRAEHGLFWGSGGETRRDEL